MSGGIPRKVVCAVCGYESPVFKDKETDRVYCPVCAFSLDPDGPVILEDLNIQRFLETVKKPAYVLFWAPWDAKSDETLTLLTMETRYTKDKVITGTVNVAENPEAKRQYGVELLPTLLVFSFGREINRIVGPVSSFEISRLLKHDHF